MPQLGRCLQPPAPAKGLAPGIRIRLRCFTDTDGSTRLGLEPTVTGTTTDTLRALTHTQNFVRPLRFSLAIALAPVFERIILWVSKKTGLSKRWAFGVYLVSFGLLTATVLFGSIYLLGGFPPS
jgi:hypothetical protein